MFGYQVSSGARAGRFKKLLREGLGGLIIPLLLWGLLGPSLAVGAANHDFLVEMVSPQKFRIQPLVSGPVSAALVGGGGSQTLITRQENGHTVIDARVPVGATLRLQVGGKSLGLKMVDAEHYKLWEY
ncbi:MAG: hypothetical protein ACOZFS_01290 [Thermodesulfobacteriota bacterium]